MFVQASIRDVPRLAQIYQEDLQQTYCRILPESYLKSIDHAASTETWTRYIKASGHIVLTWQQDKQIVGFAGICPDEQDTSRLALSALYVDKCFQGRGIGKRLIFRALEYAQSQKVSKLSISVVLQNTRAKTLYERLGARFYKEYLYYFGVHPIPCGLYLWDLDEFVQEKGECPDEQNTAAESGTAGTPEKLF